MSVQWITSLEDGLEKAKKEDKLVFLDFFNPH